MSSKVIVPEEKLSNRMEEARQFLRSCGTGSTRFGGKEGNINHWLNGEDWCYYDQWTTNPEDTESRVVNTVFVFKNEAHAVEFALRFL